MTSLPALDSWLGSVSEIARDASLEILRVYDSEFAVELKADDSPLTRADLASHELICHRLEALSPGVPVLSEESPPISFAERSRWSRYWLVDPLDGTKEFVKRNGEFTVNIALIEGHEVVLGVVWVPVTDTGYLAARGVGASKLSPGAPDPVPLATRPADPARLVVAGSRSHGADRLESFVKRLPGLVEVSSCGSSLKLCLVAEGRTDVYPRFGPTSEWDTAAAQCVVELAGGSVTDLAFQPIRYNTKDSLLNPDFIAVGDPSFAWERYLDAGS